MNVYDFDKTVYPGDSATHFLLFCLRRYPFSLARLPGGLAGMVRSRREKGLRGAAKEGAFAILAGIPDTEEAVKAFWDRHIDRIYPWYLAQRREDDLVISASPFFLVSEACRRLGIACMATDMDPKTGRLLGPNCHDREKVVRFREVYGEVTPEEFYSDSFSDRPMMELAERAYLIKNGVPVSLGDLRRTGKEQL